MASRKLKVNQLNQEQKQNQSNQEINQTDR